MLQAIVFDYDGVLADTEPLHLRAFQESLAGHGLTLSDADYYEHYLGLDDEGVFHAIADREGRACSVDEVRAFVQRKARRFLEISQSTRVLYPGAAERLRDWSGRVPVAIASGSLRHEIELVLEAESLRDTIPVIVAAGETAHGKPAADPYVRALELLCARRPGTTLDPGRCVAVEDSPWGIDAARGARMKSVAVTTSYPAARLSGADAIVGAIGDLEYSLLDRVAGGA
jgi:beta-phosphoglucomutase